MANDVLIPKKKATLSSRLSIINGLPVFLFRFTAIAVFSLTVRSLVAAANLAHIVKDWSWSMAIATFSATARVGKAIVMVTRLIKPFLVCHFAHPFHKKLPKSEMARALTSFYHKNTTLSTGQPRSIILINENLLFIIKICKLYAYSYVCFL